MLALIYATTASGAFFAFTDWTGIGACNFVGLDNFARIFQTDGADRLAGQHAGPGVRLPRSSPTSSGLLFALALNRTLKSPVTCCGRCSSCRWSSRRSRCPTSGSSSSPSTARSTSRLGGRRAWTSWQQDWLADPTLALIARPRRDGLAEHRLRDGHLPRRAGHGAGRASRRRPRSTAPASCRRFWHVTAADDPARRSPSRRPSRSSRACASSTRCCALTGGGPAGRDPDAGHRGLPADVRRSASSASAPRSPWCSACSSWSSPSSSSTPPATAPDRGRDRTPPCSATRRRRCSARSSSILAALVMLLPFYFLITTSLKTGQEVLTDQRARAARPARRSSNFVDAAARRPATPRQHLPGPPQQRDHHRRQHLRPVAARLARRLRARPQHQPLEQPHLLPVPRRDHPARPSSASSRCTSGRARSGSPARRRA